MWLGMASAIRCGCFISGSKQSRCLVSFGMYFPLLAAQREKHKTVIRDTIASGKQITVLTSGCYGRHFGW